MKEQLEERLQQLKQEYESGRKMLADLEAKQADLQQTLLRISGAIQVLEEMMTAEGEREETSHPPLHLRSEFKQGSIATAGLPRAGRGPGVMRLEVIRAIFLSAFDLWPASANAPVRGAIALEP
jgi:hypothetical protein